MARACLRAKIDMAAGNINLRDPVLYRILHAHHPRTGTKWSIYPSYDYAHGQSDAIEGITHSICTLEFEDHRPLYDWFIEQLPVPSKPHQYEFARLNLTYTVLSKRVLTQLVRDGHVASWDDPRMPTIAGLKRRGVPPAAIREFIKRIGVAKANSVVDVGMLEFCIREELNRTSLRRMAVLRPLKVVIENYPEGQVEEIEAINHPDNPEAGTRKIAFGRELYIEQDDFMENPPKKFFRLSPGNEVRLRYAYFIKCTSVVKNAAGEVTELRCTYDPETRGGNAPDGRKVKATMHWLPAAQSRAGRNPHLQPALRQAEPGCCQFRRRPQSAVAGDPERRPGRARSRRGQFARRRAVRAARLLRPRQRFDAGPSGVEPNHRVARHLCEGSRQGLVQEPGTCLHRTVIWVTFIPRLMGLFGAFPSRQVSDEEAHGIGDRIPAGAGFFGGCVRQGPSQACRRNQPKSRPAESEPTPAGHLDAAAGRSRYVPGLSRILVPFRSPHPATSGSLMAGSSRVLPHGRAGRAGHSIARRE